MRALSTPYSKAEKAAVRRLYPAATVEEVLAALPGRSWDGVQHQARQLKVKRTAAGNRGKNNKPWSVAHEEILRAHYQSKGAAYVGNLVGRKPGTVTMRARKLGLPKLPAPKPTPAPKLVTPVHDPRPKAANTLKPLRTSAPKPTAEPVKRSPATPNLNAAKDARLRQEQANKGLSIAEQVRKLPANSEGRKVYMRAASQGGPAATAAFLDWQRQQAA